MHYFSPYLHKTFTIRKECMCKKLFTHSFYELQHNRFKINYDLSKTKNSNWKTVRELLYTSLNGIMPGISR